jgi:hypothetical protein
MWSKHGTLNRRAFVKVNKTANKIWSYPLNRTVLGRADAKGRLIPYSIFSGGLKDLLTAEAYRIIDYLKVDSHNVDLTARALNEIIRIASDDIRFLGVLGNLLTTTLLHPRAEERLLFLIGILKAKEMFPKLEKYFNFNADGEPVVGSGVQRVSMRKKDYSLMVEEALLKIGVADLYTMFYKSSGREIFGTLYLTGNSGAFAQLADIISVNMMEVDKVLFERAILRGAFGDQKEVKVPVRNNYLAIDAQHPNGRKGILFTWPDAVWILAELGVDLI